MIGAGVDGLAHICTEPASQDLLDAYKKHRPFVMPTPVVQASGSGEEQESREKFAHDLAEDEKERMCFCLKVTRGPKSVVNAANTVRALKSMGIDIACDTDSSGHLIGTSASASVHHELWLSVNRCSMSPIEALRSATSVSARCMRMPDRGMIKQGLTADLALVHGNPIDDIEALRDVKAVWRNGEMLSVR